MVTGGGSGLGQVIALAFSREGAAVVVNDIDEASIEGTVEKLRELGADSMGIKADVASSQEVRAMFSRLVERFGTLDILVNNAGTIKVTDKVKENFPKYLRQIANTGTSKMSLGATRYMSDEQWERMVAVHLHGTFYCTREALAIMEDKGSGKIINMASICGLSGFCAICPDYTAAKGGVIAFTRAVAEEAIRRGVYVNAIAPGFVETPGLRAGLTREIVNAVALRTPLGRLGTPEEIASLAVYLASDESSYLVGQIISPNGGLVI